MMTPCPARGAALRQKTCLLVLIAAGSALSAAGQRREGSAWVGTWASAPMAGETSPALAAQTLRQIVRTCVAGSEVRIRVSNLFGAQPLRIEDVHLAIASTGGAIVAGTDHAVRFAHRTFVVVPAGSSLVSDPVRMKLPALTEVAVSFYLPEIPGPITWHPSAHRTNYRARGDVSGQIELPDAATTGSYYFLTNVDVQGKELKGAVVTLGASITEGYKATDAANDGWPEVLAQRLASQGIRVGVLNEGISGNRLLHAGAGPSAESRFQRDVVQQPAVRWVIFADDPINDLGSTHPPPTLPALIEGTEHLIAAAHRNHIRFYCSTLTPFEGADYWTPAEEVTREGFNYFIWGKASGCDAVIDQDEITHDPAHPTRFLPAYDSGDHLHPNDAGHRAIADGIDLSLLR
ncbi:MAG TPA: GDSL-type esterase/lipase family protein [Acidobacteriaceae bacterium]|jgi:lysophospholipase L1-like esterase|nr:GDSL-type esterase/lipase family protein [Acidobacteriaceae bacterium]